MGIILKFFLINNRYILFINIFFLNKNFYQIFKNKNKRVFFLKKLPFMDSPFFSFITLLVSLLIGNKIFFRNNFINYQIKFSKLLPFSYQLFN